MKNFCYNETETKPRGSYNETETETKPRGSYNETETETKPQRLSYMKPITFYYYAAVDNTKLDFSWKQEGLVYIVCLFCWLRVPK